MYTHLVKYKQHTKFCGIVACEFRTTADAVALHKTALERRQRAGEVVEFEIVAI